MINNRLFTTLLLVVLSLSVFGQKANTFTDKNGNEHLWGVMSEKDILKHKTHKEWYQKFYDKFEIGKEDVSKLDMLKRYTIKAYYGSWCGDSKKLLPPFMKVMKEIGAENKVEIIGLHIDDDKYKKGPKGEEKGAYIHRVPTFIFEENGKEVARIVESPANDLMTDLNQIAAGYPSIPNYRSANWLMQELAEKPIKELDEKKVIKKIGRQVKRLSELNTLGYIYLSSKEYDKASFVFRINKKLFPNEPNVYDSLAECYMEMGDKESAIENYQIALDKNPKDKNIIKQLSALYAESN